MKQYKAINMFYEDGLDYNARGGSDTVVILASDA